MEVPEKVNFNIRLGRLAYSGLAGAAMPKFDDDFDIAAPQVDERVSGTDRVDTQFDDSEQDAHAPTGQESEMPQLRYLGDTPVEESRPRRRMWPVYAGALIVALGLAAGGALWYKSRLAAASVAGPSTSNVAAEEDAGLVVVGRPYFKGGAASGPVAGDAPAQPVPPAVLADATQGALPAPLQQDDGPVTLRPIEPSAADLPADPPKAKPVAVAKAEATKALPSQSTTQQKATPPTAKSGTAPEDTVVVFNESAPAQPKKRAEADGESAGQRIAKAAAAQRLVAIKDDKTIVVHDPKSGVPKAVHVGEALPSGAKLVEVNVASGIAKTDAGTTLKLE